MLPSLHALSLDAARRTRRASATGAPGDADDEPVNAESLPPELWEAILTAVESEGNPCSAIVAKCSVRKEWARWCRNGALYEAANRALGFYGKFASLKEVQADVARRSDFPIWEPPPTPKQYFQQACQAIYKFDYNLTRPHTGRGRQVTPPVNLDWWLQPRYMERPYFAAIMKHFLSTRPRHGDGEYYGLRTLQRLPTDIADYAGIAMAALKLDGRALQYVPDDAPNYRELAEFAISRDVWLLQNVSTSRADYAEIAKFALNKGTNALQVVPTDIADYGEVALVAVSSNGFNLEAVPTDRADYGEIARIAVGEGMRFDGFEHDFRVDDGGPFEGCKINPLLFVPTDRADYGAIARIAVTEVPDAICFVPTDRADYLALARIAIRQDRRLLSSLPLPKERADYGKLFALALRLGQELEGFESAVWEDDFAKSLIEEEPGLLRWVPKNHGDYDTLVETALLGKASTLRWVDSEHPSYSIWAALALGQDAMTLQWVPSDRADYGGLARYALKRNGMALRYVPTDRADYLELARLAVRQNDRAMLFVPEDLAEALRAERAQGRERSENAAARKLRYLADWNEERERAERAQRERMW